jgi:IS5 family transposase
VVDATIISAPSSTKNEEKERDPEMASTKKGNNPKYQNSFCKRDL